MATPKRGKWTLGTFVKQLRLWCIEVYDEDIMVEPKAEALTKPLSALLEDFQSHELRQLMVVQIPGQTQAVIDDKTGEVEGIGET